MDASHLLARIYGILFVVIAFSVLMKPGHYRKLVSEFFESSALVYLSGVIALTVGIVMVTFHNIWTTDWRVIITIMGWIACFKGAIRLLFPQLGREFVGGITDNPQPVTLSAAVVLIFGLLLTAMGFWG